MTDDGSVKGVVNTLRHVKDMDAVPGAIVPGLRVLRNYVDRRLKSYRQIMEDLDLPGVCEQLGVRLMATEIPLTTNFKNAASDRRPLIALPCAPSDHRLAAAVNALQGLADELVAVKVAA